MINQHQNMKFSYSDVLKTAMVLCLIWIAYSIHNFSQRDRYQITHIDNTFFLFEPSTGRMFFLAGKEYIQIAPREGELLEDKKEPTE